MKNLLSVSVLGLAAALSLLPCSADERRFTYVYEPETLPAGGLDIENRVTLRTQRSKAVGQDNFNLWELRQEIEYGVSDRYTVAFYLNEQAESYRDPATGLDHDGFDWEGVSLENKYNILNPAEHAIGLTAYLEGRYSGTEAGIEQKIIIGQRYGRWKWAFNLEHETEWEDNLHAVEGEVGASGGVAYDFAKNWSIGLEARNINTLPEYNQWESSAIYAGPVLSFRQEKWWAALSVLPQLCGWNSNESEDRNRSLDLAHNERVNIRLLVGFSF